MSVHTGANSLKVVAMIFEARYDEGYRFLDHAGELLTRIRRNHPFWVVANVTQKLVTLIHQEHGLVVSIGTEKMDISTTDKWPISEAEKKSQLLGKAADNLYSLTLEVLKVPRTTRVGTRFGFLAPSDNLEEADRFVWKAAASPLLNAIVEVTKGLGIEAQLSYILDDPDSGYRQRVTLAAVVLEQKPEDPPFLGLPGDPGSGGVVVDIDTYMRPEETHLGKPGVFVQGNYLKSRSQATNIFAWTLSQQK